MKQTEMSNEELEEHMKDWARFLYKMYKKEKIKKFANPEENKPEK